MADLPRRERHKAGAAFWIHFLALVALAIIAVVAIVDDEPQRAALAVVAGGALLIGVTLGTLAALLAALLGAWDIAVIGIAGTVTPMAPGVITTLPLRRSDDHDALREALAGLPGPLAYALQIRAGDGPLTTRQIVAGALRADPERWRPLLGDDPGETAWDGPVVDAGDGGRATVFAAESAGLAAVLAARFKRPLDVELLALAACTNPLSAADAWIEDVEEATDALLGAPLIEVVECVSRFAGTRAGRDVMRRARLGYWSRRLSIDDRELMYEFRFRRLPRLAREVLSS